MQIPNELTAVTGRLRMMSFNNVIATTYIKRVIEKQNSFY